LKSRAADANKDGEISVSELRDHLTATVSALSGGTQVPVSRYEAIEFDRRVW
jgi:hypothetical protein